QPLPRITNFGDRPVAIVRYVLRSVPKQTRQSIGLRSLEVRRVEPLEVAPVAQAFDEAGAHHQITCRQDEALERGVVPRHSAATSVSSRPLPAAAPNAA